TFRTFHKCVKKRKWCTNNRFHIIFGWHFFGCFINKGNSLFQCFIHFPISGNNVLSHANNSQHLIYLSAKASTPGSTFPSINSSDPPPPVETRSIASAKPQSATALAESPPPIMVNPAASASALATAHVPPATVFISNTSVGPFQMVSFESLTIFS